MDTEIKIQIGKEVKVLEGQELEAFLEQKKLDDAEVKTLDEDKNAKASARTSALAKLAELGLTEEEVAAL
jgi:sulfur carrier protein ThiS